MNHLGDTNKMVDTPRTETYVLNPLPQVVSAEWARQLECELNAANTEIEEKRKDVVWLATEKAKLENYVMLLEQAGDEAICPLEYAARVRIWNKAKEDKP